MGREDETVAALNVWGERLISVSGTNRLIQFRPSKTGAVLIDSPNHDLIFEAVASGEPCAFRGDPDDPDPEPFDGGGGIRLPRSQVPMFHSPRPDKELGPVLRNLMRRATTEFLDRGLSVLYVAFGMLHWRDTDDTAMVSPLYLVPVALLSQGPKAAPYLSSREDDAVINPALALRLRDFNIALPSIDEIDGLSVSEVLESIQESLRGSDDATAWEIRPTTYLSMFSFAKEAMFRDLKENEDRIVQHPIVQALATKDPTQQTSDFVFDEIRPEDVEREAPPEETPLVLDADSSQRAAVAAALAGRTFVMDGPPGTGKSQTIANMIGALLHAGKSVLFVSEKMAALDVVRNRLAQAGLENYLLELHSHKASRKEVATELLRALDNEPVPPAGMASLDRLTVKDRRDKLNDYAEAMNAVREPLGMSLHHVLGVLAKLHDVPSAPASEMSPDEFRQDAYRSFQEAAEQLERNWRPASQGSSFLWRDAIDESSLDIRLYQAESALDRLEGTVALNSDLTDLFNLRRPSDTPRLQALLAHQHRQHPAEAMEPWLTTHDWAALLEIRDQLRRQVEAAREGEAATRSLAGVDWRELPEAHGLPPSPPPIPVRQAVDLSALTADELARTAQRFESTAGALQDRLDALRNLGASLGLPEIVTFAQAEDLMRLVELRRSATAIPDRRWFTEAGLRAAREIAGRLREAVRGLDDAERTAARTYTPDALEAPLTELQDRFTHLHKGLKKLSGRYRADKRAVQALLTRAVTVKEGIQHLSDAIAWYVAQRQFDDLGRQDGDMLGSYWKGRTTDFSALNDALSLAETAITLAGSNVPPQLASFLSAADPGLGQQAIVDSARSDFERWKSSLAEPPTLSGRPALLVEPIPVSIDWLTAHILPMRDAAQRLAAVDSASGRSFSLAEADQALALRTRTAAGHGLIANLQEAYVDAFGNHFQGSATDLDRLDGAIVRAEELRKLVGGPLTNEQVKALKESEPVESLDAAYAKWADALNRVISAFAESRHAELNREFDDYLNARDLINNLRADTTGQQEWFAHLDARRRLAELHLDSAIDFCIEHRIPEDAVRPVLHRALLRGWADTVIHSDGRLRPFLAQDHDALVREYRRLDQNLIINATSDIIGSVNTRRPHRADVGEPGVIRRQGMLKRKHLPVRELIRGARNTILAIKPCFMMSPLAVSQYLPPDMSFDVVIFDEASQVTPGDAINCIYRGKSMILAGDDKQLPPTSFFERVVEEEGDEETDVADFQSVLELAKGCGAFRNLGLRWHYRSRHESLIAFSNYKFYEGKLITYPSSMSEGEDVGVAFYKTNGTYRRGGGADNPREAARVAERVIGHFTKRPDLSLGVVTFSVAQTDAVIAAIDKARENRRDLDRFFDTGDRLNGFFVRSLESVQGDERDVIIFSVGYGPDEAGKVTTNFGVLNKPKGWRRLNVGITRARQRVEVVASMYGGAIPPSQNESVNFLRAYLDYAARGMTTLAVEQSSTGLQPESPFEESVLETIKSWGYTVEPQVGAAGFRIDIGVRHPAFPGMFALGVECDGYQYHSAPAARDRDRLRDQVLGGLGWQLHRIWGTAWYRDRVQEESRLHSAIQTAIAAPIEGRIRASDDLQRPAVSTIAVESAVTPAWTTPYEIGAPHELNYWVDPSEIGSHMHMRDALVALAQAEGPVHLDLVYERIRDWWGIGRVSYKVRDNVERAIRSAPLIRDGDFIDIPERVIDRVRTPTVDVVRKAEQVHIQELALAVELTLRDVGAADRKELVIAIARLFGWGRTGSLVDRRVAEAINLQIESGVITSDSGRLSLART